MRWLLLLVVVSACGHAPPPELARSELLVTSPASFAGHWVADDDLDWGYHLEIKRDGTLHLIIDRGKMGLCEQVGTLRRVSDARSDRITEVRSYRITYDRNTCNSNAAGASLEVAVASFTNDLLTLVITGDGIVERRTYVRDPKHMNEPEPDTAPDARHR